MRPPPSVLKYGDRKAYIGSRKPCGMRNPLGARPPLNLFDAGGSVFSNVLACDPGRHG